MLVGGEGGRLFTALRDWRNIRLEISTRRIELFIHDGDSDGFFDLKIDDDRTTDYLRAAKGGEKVKNARIFQVEVSFPRPFPEFRVDKRSGGGFRSAVLYCSTRKKIFGRRLN